MILLPLGGDKDIASVSTCTVICTTWTAPHQNIQQGGREQVRAATRRSRESRVDRGRSSISRFDWIGDMDAAGPIVAACASVEWLQLLISPEVCPEEREALLSALEQLSHQLKISGRVA